MRVFTKVKEINSSSFIGYVMLDDGARIRPLSAVIDNNELTIYPKLISMFWTYNNMLYEN